MEYAWVIEHKDSPPGQPIYFTGFLHAALQWSNPGKHLAACRFSRKEDAERIAAFAGFYEPNPTHYIREHGWDDGDNGDLWSKQPPTEQGEYWHWSGHPDCAALPTFVMWSGFNKKCFVSSGQLGIQTAIDCDEYGGWWKKISAPRLPDVRSVSPEMEVSMRLKDDLAL